jgi:2-aminoadipate transaminase
MTTYDSFFSQSAQTMKESSIRRMGKIIASRGDVISFAPGYPAPETFAWAEFREITAALLDGTDGNVLQYGPTRGYRPLLEQIAGILEERDIRSPLEDLIITTGSQQGLDLVGRVLFDPGDIVLVELPTYTGAITAFGNVQAQLVGVPQEADGIDFDALERIYQRLRTDGQRVKALYVVPNFQNPTGLLIGLEKRRRLLEWAARRDVLLIEDDPYHDLYFEDSATPSEVRSIKADDRDGRVVYLSSFSKTLAPGYRVAWIAAPAPIAQKIEIAKQSDDLLTGSLDQRVVFEACRSGLLARQLPKLRRYYGEKRDVMTRTLRRELSGAVTWPDPKGGFFLWLTLPDQLDTDLMIPRAVEHGVVYVAGEAFFVQGDGKSTMRLSFSAPTQEQIEEGVVRLARTVREELETVSASLRAPGQAAR